MKAGEFFILGFDGKTVPNSLKELALRYGLGGVIHFDRNIESPSQLKKLNHALQNLSPDQPLLISVDQEGGRFQRLKSPLFGKYPPACDVNCTTALEVGRQMGAELHDLGFNFDNAPVLDVNINPNNPIIGKRSFSSDPRVVAQIGQLFIQGLQEKGIMACGKHFPGHGDTDTDSHLTLPVVRKNREVLEQCELYPFKKLIQTKYSSASALKCLMTAHVVYPALDPDLPATFSKKIMTDLLRKEWGYEGLVITDDLGMAGSLSRGDVPSACIEAFAAGCDLLLVCEHLERHFEIVEKFEKALTQSNFLKKRILESTERIEKFKKGAGKK
ncbi:MAG: beta-N-acetylhexosaminidase [Deltaproteobacteria bacterium]|nr:beta-N-acetylhexosaminidase [Deltaproteobacteria bacterium]